MPAHQPFSFNSLGLSAPEEACSGNVRASGTLKFGYEGIFKISDQVRMSLSIFLLNINMFISFMHKVMQHCHDIPTYTPVATFIGGTYHPSLAESGVFLGCLNEGFKVSADV